MKEIIQKGIYGFKSTGARELVDDGVVSVIIVVKIGVIFTGVLEYLEGKVEVLLAGDNRDKAFV